MNIKPQNKYAVIMTSTYGLLPGVNAFLNGLDYYGNSGLDFHLINDFPPDYFEKAKALSFPVFDIRLEDIKQKANLPPHKRGGWQVRFFRWRWAKEIADSYDAVMIVDADMCCVNNVMKYFKIAKDTGFIIAQNNPCGYPMEHILEHGIEGVRGAQTPPVHCQPVFIDPRRYKDFLDTMWDWGIKEDYGDMTTFFRTIYREKLLDQLLVVPDHLWGITLFYFDKIERKVFGGKPYLLYGKDRINMFHGRWWITSVQAQIENCKEPWLIDFGRNNIRLFWETIKRLNTEHKIKIDYNWEWYKDISK